MIAFWACGHIRRRPAPEFAKCPACAAQDRRNATHWGALLLAIALLLTVTCCLVGGQ